MCDLQIKQAVNLDTQRKVILVLHYNDIELVITDSNVIKEYNINSREVKRLCETSHGRFVTGTLHNSMFVCITSSNYGYVIDMERRRKKKGFHLGNSNMIKMCCLNGDHLVCATEDDFLVYVNITNRHSSSYPMKSHIVSLCSYDDRFLVIDESGTFHFYRCDRGFQYVDRHDTNCPCSFAYIPRQDCYSVEPEYPDCLLYNEETHSIVRYQLPTYEKIVSYDGFDEDSRFSGMCLYGDVLCFLFGDLLHIYRLDDNMHIATIPINSDFLISTISATSQFIVLGSCLGEVYYCMLDEDESDSGSLRSSLVTDDPNSDSVDDDDENDKNESSTRSFSYLYTISKDLKQLLEDSLAFPRTRPALSKDLQDWEEFYLFNKMIFNIPNEESSQMRSEYNHKNSCSSSHHLPAGTGVIDGFSITDNQIPSNQTQPSEPLPSCPDRSLRGRQFTPLIVVSLPPRPSGSQYSPSRPSSPRPSGGQYSPSRPSGGQYSPPRPSSPHPSHDTKPINQSQAFHSRSPKPSSETNKPGVTPRSLTEEELRVLKMKYPKLLRPKAIITKKKKECPFNEIPPNGRKQGNGIVLTKDFEKRSCSSSTSSRAIPRTAQCQEPQGVVIRDYCTSDSIPRYDTFSSELPGQQRNDVQDMTMNDDDFIRFMNERISDAHRAS